MSALDPRPTALAPRSTPPPPGERDFFADHFLGDLSEGHSAVLEAVSEAAWREAHSAPGRRPALSVHTSAAFSSLPRRVRFAAAAGGWEEAVCQDSHRPPRLWPIDRPAAPPRAQLIVCPDVLSSRVGGR